MARLTFEDLRFSEEKDFVKVTFLNIFYFNLAKKDLLKISDFEISGDSIDFKDISEKKSENKFYNLLSDGFKGLKNTITGQETVYIHKNSGIPLIGNNAFGLIDRNTSIIEVRVITGCNIDCLYCSVDQSQRPTDFVVEKDYLAEEFKKLVEFKGIDEIEAHIGTQGEPLLYAPLADLIKDISSIPEVSTIALDTNGTLLTKNKVDELVKAGLTRFCFSLNALDKELAKKIAVKAYNPDHIKEIIEYIAKKAEKKECELILTPVWVPGINDPEIPKIIELSKKLNCKIGIQNFLNYKFGKNPAKQMSWDEFIKRMKEFEEKYGIHLLFDFKKDFNIRQTSPLPKPFKKGDIVKARIMCKGRLKREMIAVSNERTITIPNCNETIGKEIKVKITRTKHNIFYGIRI